MEIIRSLDDLPQLVHSVATIGSFDGIHRGHQALLEETVRQSRNLSIPSVVLTFFPHPQQILRPDEDRPIRLLAGVEEKAFFIQRYADVDYLLVLDFNRGFAHQSAEEFLQEILLRKLRVKHVVVGYDHRFGHQRKGNAEWLAARGEDHGFTVSQIGPIRNETMPVSSTLIRDHIQSDRLDLANAMLGHPYTVFGTVVQGDGRGKALNYPTANVDPAMANKLVPNRGVYLVRVSVNGFISFGMGNIGIRPTFDDGEAETIEVHLFDWEASRGDFYDETVIVEFLQKLRDEKKFENVEDLIQQLDDDKKTCLAIIEKFREI